MKYHNNFFIKNNSKRKNLYERLDKIKNSISAKNSLLDIGCSGGFNSFGLCDYVSNIDAFDFEQPLINECLDIQKKYKTNINFTKDNIVNFLDTNDNKYDTILYLSIHHHIIKQYGMAKAKKILKRILQITDVMFFDMGQKDENCPQHNWWKLLPPTKDIKGWMKNYIIECTGASHIELVGHTNIHNTKRLLWEIKN